MLFLLLQNHLGQNPRREARTCEVRMDAVGGVEVL